MFLQFSCLMWTLSSWHASAWVYALWCCHMIGWSAWIINSKCVFCFKTCYHLPDFVPVFTFPVFSLQDLCCRAIVSCTPVHLIDKLPLPVAIKSHLKSFSMANGMNAVMMHGRSYSLANSGGSKGNSLKRSKSIRPPQSPPQNCTRNNCKIS